MTGAILVWTLIAVGVTPVLIVLSIVFRIAQDNVKFTREHFPRREARRQKRESKIDSLLVQHQRDATFWKTTLVNSDSPFVRAVAGQMLDYLDVRYNPDLASDDPSTFWWALAHGDRVSFKRGVTNLPNLGVQLSDQRVLELVRRQIELVELNEYRNEYAELARNAWLDENRRTR